MSQPIALQKGEVLICSPSKGYWCVICGRHLPADSDGVIVHDNFPHPLEMDFYDEDNPQ